MFDFASDRFKFFSLGALTYILVTKMRNCCNKKLPDATSKIQEWEKENNSKLILMIHKEEDRSLIDQYLFADNQSRYIDQKSADRIQKLFSELDENKTIDLVIHTNGGDVSSAKVICDVLLNHKGPIRIYVPYRAYSGGTMLSLCGTELYLDKNAHLSPFDPQLYGFPSESIIGALRGRELSECSEPGSVLKDMCEKANKLINSVFERIKDKHDDSKKIYDNLVSGNLSHSHILNIEECRDIGIKLNEGIPDKMKEIIKFYL